MTGASGRQTEMTTGGTEITEVDLSCPPVSLRVLCAHRVPLLQLFRGGGGVVVNDLPAVGELAEDQRKAAVGSFPVG